MKKLFKIIGIILLLGIIVLASIPFILESKIDTIVQNYVDKNVNAKVEFDDISLSLLSSFPNANVNIENLKITTYAPFEDETLANAKQITLKMPIKEVFKSASDDPMKVTEIIADEVLLTLQTKTNNEVNYDILKSTDSTASGSFSFDVEDYKIKNSAFTYLDESSETVIYITNINHEGNGRFTESISELDTETTAKMSLAIDSVEYLKNHDIKLDALIDLDLDNDKYTFKENQGFVNDLPLIFEGFVQNVDDGQLIDITFKNPESDFKNFLAIIPEVYRKNLENVKTTGDFKVNGIIKGLVSDETIPNLDINMSSNNASFQYPNLQKSMQDIVIDASVKNNTGKTEDTYLDINTLNFRIDQDVFRAEAHLKDLMENIKVNAKVNGVLNLANLAKAYPIDMEQNLSGILRADIATNFDMNAVETNAYQRIKTTGKASITDFVFSSEEMANPLQINSANINFTPSTVTLNEFTAKTGNTDLVASGTLENFIGFLVSSDQPLRGNFNVTSQRFEVSDFIVNKTTGEEGSASTATGKELKLPAFLDANVKVKANTVIYDNLTLKNVNGKLSLKDETARLTNVTTDIFNGNLALSGLVSTKNNVPTFNMELGMNGLDISESFKGFDLLTKLAPIADILEGKLNSAIKLNGALDGSFSPDLSSITGDALAEILTTKLTASQSEVLKGISSKLDFIDWDKFDLEQLKTNLSFEKGQVSVKPFSFSYRDIPINVSGTHGFDNSMNYQLVLDVPAKYLGSEVNRLIGKINDNEVNQISIPVTASLSGSFGSPKVSTDLPSGVKNLTAQLIEIQKQKLVGKGKDKIKDLLGMTGTKPNQTNDSTVVVPNTTPITPGTDSIPAQTTQPKGVRETLKDLLKKTKKQTDSTKNGGN
ncbi:AsmA-like C-terminal region-containing protein [Winogradskyella maritima]|uniref:AsmA-like C-terminal region-containing protein n=1 Tax=Winogradskyella maritima TaxID=1517766 RepID=A0ABV8AG00_9FLAO|nr:AsmA-like C-terminal region-containing protein [Winogradskyella maritima]